MYQTVQNNGFAYNINQRTEMSLAPFWDASPEQRHPSGLLIPHGWYSILDVFHTTERNIKKKKKSGTTIKQEHLYSAALDRILPRGKTFKASLAF